MTRHILATSVALTMAGIMVVETASRLGFISEFPSYNGSLDANFTNPFRWHLGLDYFMINDGGGSIAGFRDAAKQVRDTLGARLVIGGECYSACASLAELAPDQTCLLPGAELYYHKTDAEMIPPDYSFRTRLFVALHGGWPSYKSQKFTRMPYEEALKRWPECPLLILTPEPSQTAFISWLIIESAIEQQAINIRSPDAGLMVDAMRLSDIAPRYEVIRTDEPSRFNFQLMQPDAALALKRRGQ